MLGMLGSSRNINYYAEARPCYVCEARGLGPVCRFLSICCPTLRAPEGLKRRTRRGSGTLTCLNQTKCFLSGSAKQESVL